MARFSIPQAVLNSNITMRKARGQKMNTDFGGVPVFRMAWDTLGMDKIVASSGILRNGIPAEKLTFAAVFKCVSGSSSNASFENSSSDPAFAKVCGLDRIDQVTLSRFMNDDRYDWTDLLAHTVQALSSYPAFVPKSSGYLVIDDTILDKSGKKMDKVKKLKDPSTNRYVIGYNLVNLIYAEPGRYYPIGFEYRVFEDGEPTKPELAAGLIRKAIRQGFRQMVIFDSAYFCKEITTLLDKTGLPWVGKCKSNRVFYYNGKEMSASEIARSLPRKMFRRHKKYRDIRYASVRAILPGHGPVRLVVCENFREDEPENESVEVKYIVSSSPELKGSKIIGIYKMRWKVECYHRSAKQTLGLKKYHGRKYRGLVAHTTMVCIAYILVELLKVLLPSLSDETLGSIVETLIQYSTRISIRDGRLTVLVHSDFAHPKALRQFQLARAG